MKVNSFPRNILFAFTVVLAIPRISGIQCYNEEVHVLNCDVVMPGATGCKYETTTTGHFDVAEGCAFKSSGCDRNVLENNQVYTTCYCSTDLCNKKPQNEEIFGIGARPGGSSLHCYWGKSESLIETKCGDAKEVCASKGEKGNMFATGCEVLPAGAKVGCHRDSDIEDNDENKFQVCFCENDLCNNRGTVAVKPRAWILAGFCLIWLWIVM